MRRREGVMKRFFGESGCYCYLMICLKCFQSLVGQNMIRITYRHGWKRTQLVLVKYHVIRLPGRACYNFIWAGRTQGCADDYFRTSSLEINQQGWVLCISPPISCVWIFPPWPISSYQPKGPERRVRNGCAPIPAFVKRRKPAPAQHWVGQREETRLGKGGHFPQCKTLRRTRCTRSPVMSVPVDLKRKNEFTFQTESMSRPARPELPFPLTSVSPSVPSALVGYKITIWESVIRCVGERAETNHSPLKAGSCQPPALAQRRWGGPSPLHEEDWDTDSHHGQVYSTYWIEIVR